MQDHPAGRTLGVLAEALNGHGLRAVQEPTSVKVPELRLRFELPDFTLQHRGGGSVGTMTFKARTPAAGSEGIDVLQIGLGATDEAAEREAVLQYLIGVLPVLVSVLRPQAPLADHEVRVNLVASLDVATGQPVCWKAHLGDIISRVWFDDPLLHTMYVPPVSELLNVLIPVLHTLAPARGLLWLECFTSRRAAPGSARATCRLRNVDWQAGEEALLRWTENWPSEFLAAGCRQTPSCLHMMSCRQFILLEPASTDQLPAGVLAQLGKPAPRPSFWKRLTGRA